jgi:hypothetical protein
MARIEGGHQDLYEPGTRLERGYIAGISSLSKDNSIQDAATVTTDIIARETISSINDAEFDLDKVDKVA